MARVLNGETSTTRLSLLLRVRDLGDADAWRDFLECYAPRIFAWCRRFGLQDADAADATQTVLTKLVSALRTFTYDAQRGGFRAWLKTVTRHAATDLVTHLRERGTGRSSMLLLEQLSDDDPAEQLHQELEHAYRDELLRRASLVVQLRVKAETWEAWQLSNGSMTAPEIARQLAMPIGNVYVARSRVLKMLRDEIARLEADDDAT